jgi:peptidoglycan/LPS O-acetylase OafA/YrhL
MEQIASTTLENTPLPENTCGRPSWINSGRLYYLDGLRALAIIAVVISHLGPQISSPILQNLPIANGHLGVTLFFVLSGFLITLLMLREFNTSGNLSLSNFYKRRILRIFPAYLFYICIIFILQLLGLLHIAEKYWISTVFYTMCYMNNLNYAWEIGHTWSLSVEEHYYIIWPVIFSYFKPKRAVKFVFAYIILIPFLRYTIWQFARKVIDIDYASLTQMGSIAVGCLIAFIANRDIFPKISERIQKYPFIGISTGILLLLLSLKMSISGKYAILLGDPVNALSFGLVILSILHINNSKSILFRIMNSKLATWVGSVSYSIYLWQQPFSGRGCFSTVFPHWIVNIITIFICSSISYYGIEKPFLRLKDKLKLHR